jgi:hypothetical protein
MMGLLLFRENIRFDGTNYRTTRLNGGAELTYLINKELTGNRNGKHNHEIVLPVKYSERESNPHDF